MYSPASLPNKLITYAILKQCHLTLYSVHLAGWCNELDLPSRGCRFDSWFGTAVQQTWANSSHPAVSVTRQYDLVLAKGQWCWVTKKITRACWKVMAEYYQVYDQVTCRQTAKTTRPALSLILISSMGPPLPSNPIQTPKCRKVGFFCSTEALLGRCPSWLQKTQSVSKQGCCRV